MINMSYSLSVLKSKIIFGPVGYEIKKIRAYFDYRYIYNRMEDKGYSNEEIVKVISRFLAFNRYMREKENKETFKELYKMIAEYSDKTGVPQWELRAKLQKDFNIDI